jgi:hypothetical protein
MSVISLINGGGEPVNFAVGGWVEEFIYRQNENRKGDSAYIGPYTEHEIIDDFVVDILKKANVFIENDNLMNKLRIATNNTDIIYQPAKLYKHLVKTYTTLKPPTYTKITYKIDIDTIDMLNGYKDDAVALEAYYNTVFTAISM